MSSVVRHCLKTNFKLVTRISKHATFYSTTSMRSKAASPPKIKATNPMPIKEILKRMREKIPITVSEATSTYREKEPLKPFPNNTNPLTGEIGGPAGPEPTRYGDWERKGIVSDF